MTIAIPANRIYCPEGDKNHQRLLLIVTSENEKLTHIIAPYFDKETRLCNNDDTKTKLFFKFAGLTLHVPIYMTAKWIYHLTCLGLINEIGKTIAGSKKYDDLGTRCWRELKDMVRTPIYAVCLLGIAVAALFKVCYKNVSLYDSRKTFRKWDLLLNYGNKDSQWIIARCFKTYDIFKNTNTYEGAARNCAKMTLEARWEGQGGFCDICDNGGIVLDPNRPFYSAILKPNEVTQLLTVGVILPS